MESSRDLKDWLDSQRPVAYGVVGGIIIGTVVWVFTQNVVWLGMGLVLGIVVLGQRSKRTGGSSPASSGTKVALERKGAITSQFNDGWCSFSGPGPLGKPHRTTHTEAHQAS